VCVSCDVSMKSANSTARPQRSRGANTSNIISFLGSEWIQDFDRNVRVVSPNFSPLLAHYETSFHFPFFFLLFFTPTFPRFEEVPACIYMF